MNMIFFHGKKKKNSPRIPTHSKIVDQWAFNRDESIPFLGKARFRYHLSCYFQNMKFMFEYTIM